MQIPMILFTIIIEWKQPTTEKQLAEYQQQQMIQQLEQARLNQLSQLPEYCTRL